MEVERKPILNYTLFELTWAYNIIYNTYIQSNVYRGHVIDALTLVHGLEHLIGDLELAVDLRLFALLALPSPFLGHVVRFCGRVSLNQCNYSLSTSADVVCLRSAAQISILKAFNSQFGYCTSPVSGAISAQLVFALQ